VFRRTPFSCSPLLPIMPFHFFLFLNIILFTAFYPKKSNFPLTVSERFSVHFAKIFCFRYHYMYLSLSVLLWTYNLLVSSTISWSNI
jgi:hypothetical protein